MPSQLGQDQLVLDLLGGLTGGFFLDSGAADGVRSSNTQRLETAFGWTGICVEPNDQFFASLIRNRNCVCLNCCLYDRDGEVEFVEANTLGGILEAYQPEHLDYTLASWPAAKAADGRPLTVVKSARTLRSVLVEAGAPPIIDYWSLDTEGSELAILKTFPFDAYSFRILTVEHNRHPVREEIRLFLEAHGYERVREMGIDDCYRLLSDRTNTPSAWRSGAWRKR